MRELFRDYGPRAPALPARRLRLSLLGAASLACAGGAVVVGATLATAGIVGLTVLLAGSVVDETLTLVFSPRPTRTLVREFLLTGENWELILGIGSGTALCLFVVSLRVPTVGPAATLVASLALSLVVIMGLRTFFPVRSELGPDIDDILTDDES
jgi:hypothetical protein